MPTLILGSAPGRSESYVLWCLTYSCMSLALNCQLHEYHCKLGVPEDPSGPWILDYTGIKHLRTKTDF